MEPTRTILVPVDFEPPSLAALQTAVDLARRTGAKVVAMHAFSMPPYVINEIPEARLKEIRAQARDAARRPLEDLQARWGVATLLRAGDPAAEVLRAADELGATRIVIGTHGRRGIERLMLGSVAEMVVRRSKVPVMVVRPDEGPPDRSERRAVVLCATDLGPDSRPTLELARGFATEIGCALEIVHAYAVPFHAYPGFDALLAAQLEGELSRIAAKALEAVANELGAVRHHLVAGEAGRSILQVAEQVRPAAIVMGTHGRRGLERVLLGSVTEWVLRRSRFPVLTTHMPRVGVEEAQAETPAGPAAAPARARRDGAT